MVDHIDTSIAHLRLLLICILGHLPACPACFTKAWCMCHLLMLDLCKHPTSDTQYYTFHIKGSNGFSLVLLLPQAASTLAPKRRSCTDRGNYSLRVLLW